MSDDEKEAHSIVTWLNGRAKDCDERADMFSDSKMSDIIRGHAKMYRKAAGMIHRLAGLMK